MRQTMEKVERGWIWLPDFEEKEENAPVFAFFRKEIDFSALPEHFPVRITADSRYKLYINGAFVEAGPLKGDRNGWYYDEVETAPFLRRGKNVWAVIVLWYPSDIRKGNHGIYQTRVPGLFLESMQEDEGCALPEIRTDSSWMTKRASHIKIISENSFFAPLQIYEEAKAAGGLAGWQEEGYSCEGWESAREYVPELPKLQKRTIPFMRRRPGRFEKVSKLADSPAGCGEWEDFLQGKRRITFAAHSRGCVEIDAGELMTGYLRLCVEEGSGAKIRLLQSEAYVMSIPEGDGTELPVKGDRTDAQHGVLCGYTDQWTVSGKGSREHPEIYEPFWFRTFRFVRLSVETAEEPLVLADLDYTETGYPLDIRSEVSTSDPSMREIWDISARTLKRCMHETYEDCPFYEQLQYAMDSRSQILYTYAVSADDRLARKCMEDFRRATKYDGILNCSYPNRIRNVIPGFSVYYIGMVYDHMMYFGDRELVEEHMPVMEGILDFFRRHLNGQGIVEKIGGLNIPGETWSFIDWTPEWDATTGVPAATLQGPITMESLLYVLGLIYMEELCLFAGRQEKAREYRQEMERVREAVNTCCRGENGMYQDGPGIDTYSQHCQVFAVLTGAVSPEEGRPLLLETLEHRARYSQCSVAMMYYLFRALEKCGLYEKTAALWDTWRVMIDNHMTTCAEDPLKSRSDCHAWGALALYELPSAILGVRPGAPGYEKLIVRPHTETLDYAKGKVITPKGVVSVSWKKTEGKVDMEISTEKIAGDIDREDWLIVQ